MELEFDCCSENGSTSIKLPKGTDKRRIDMEHEWTDADAPVDDAKGNIGSHQARNEKARRDFNRSSFAGATVRCGDLLQSVGKLLTPVEGIR